ncbi:SDR family oxidoreductase [Kutzneria viridogrisea]|uniref:Short-chain dehydrogenase n=2 Tax=Kutzneria TaxID=43356 RepID=W5W1D2_9PSEU|nr:SDR family oxidoreductase [Kutzneria albida]AHH94993.1 short-chain dehydrogenase [Kutzneria albida DSM 43870]MBA8927651.1 NAD(P)-dependent dehydrogenase (short-subunit alcohol dehydrogenase family) [Kutzneria viridogrisea]
MSVELSGSRVVVIGGGSGIGRKLACAVSKAGAEVVLAGTDPRKLEWTAGELPGPVRVRRVDLAEESTVAELAASVGTIDHLVSTAGAAANGPVTELALAEVQRAFAAKVTGPLLLAKHLAGRFAEGGSMTLFSGVVAWRPAPGRAVMATTNGAQSFLVKALALELAPLRVNSVSPGIVDSGLWDGMGEGKREFLDGVARGNPTGRFGRPEDLVEAVLFAMGNRFLTGTTLHVDGGGQLV